MDGTFFNFFMWSEALMLKCAIEETRMSISDTTLGSITVVLTLARAFNLDAHREQ